ncbi:DUF1905 domain-containing protein [Candidatus Peregrinibacteria bacterium CG10_big_fil_rev_8_21_14_0_10_36_19]|nr:MAG: DUF1905 domain-containing protein [Candidatus Peregrinibacteria bacterium CG10_big_fil_rev_8_21_14_0_10_36_19]
MKNPTYKFNSQVWIYPGVAAWHFVNLDKDTSELIKNLYAPFTKGFGSLPVTVTVGKTSWETSIFPDKKSGSYLLPLKANIRKKENIKADDTIKFEVKIMTGL